MRGGWWYSRLEDDYRVMGVCCFASIVLVFWGRLCLIVYVGWVVNFEYKGWEIVF